MNYLQILNDVYMYGIPKSPVRKNNKGEYVPVDGGVRTYGLPNQIFTHDMDEGFPLLTSKKVHFHSVAVELEGFVKGITSKKWYQDRKCRIWNEWCNPKALEESFGPLVSDDGEELFFHPPVEMIKQRQKDLDDLGPIYGYQWRSFGRCYGEYDGGPVEGADQLKSIVKTLNNNYNDRRMVCSAWNPNQIDYMALPPCHWGWNVVAYGDKLHMTWVQRSCDLFLGVPFNIASYALLLTLLSKEAGLQPGNLTGVLVDCHLYENQLDVAREQLKRETHQLPEIQINNWTNIFEWEYSDAEILEYTHSGPLSVPVVV